MYVCFGIGHFSVSLYDSLGTFNEWLFFIGLVHSLEKNVRTGD